MADKQQLVYEINVTTNGTDKIEGVKKSLEEAKSNLDESSGLYREEHIRMMRWTKLLDLSGFCITMELEAAADPTLRVAHHS